MFSSRLQGPAAPAPPPAPRDVLRELLLHGAHGRSRCAISSGLFLLYLFFQRARFAARLWAGALHCLCPGDRILCPLSPRRPAQSLQVRDKVLYRSLSSRSNFLLDNVKPFVIVQGERIINYYAVLLIVLWAMVYRKLKNNFQLDFLNIASYFSLKLGLWDIQQTIRHSLCHEEIPCNKTLHFHSHLSSHELLPLELFPKSSSKRDF